MQGPTQACGPEAGFVCGPILRLTGDLTLAEFADSVLGVLGRIALIVVAAFVAWIVARRLISRLHARIVQRTMDDAAALDAERQRIATRADTVATVLRSLLAIVLFSVAILMLLGEFGVNLGPLIAAAGIIGIALGFGAQSLVSDFIAGMFMLLDDEFAIGDVVDLGEATGVVESFGLRTTKVRAVDGTLWTVHNGQIDRTGNMTHRWARAVLDVGVAYGTDLRRAAEVIRQAAEEVRADPDHAGSFLEAPEVAGVQELGDDAISLRLVVKTAPGAQFALARTLRGRIAETLESEGIEIPFPQRTVWIRTEPDTLGAPIPVDVPPPSPAAPSSPPP